MTSMQANRLRLGLYEIYWSESDGGGSSLASVGSDYWGNRWFAPTNWIKVPSFAWDKVARVRAIRRRVTSETVREKRVGHNEKEEPEKCHCDVNHSWSDGKVRCPKCGALYA